MPANLAELAARFDCELRGDADLIVDSVGTLVGAGASEITFFVNPLYRSQLAQTKAAAVVLHKDYESDCPAAALVSSNPYATYARISEFLHPRAIPAAGIHPTAVISEDAVVPESAHIGAHAVIGERTTLDESVLVGAGCIIGNDVRVGAHTQLLARNALMDRVVVGARCTLHPGVVIGSDGFGFAKDGGSWLRVPQLGTVIIGNDVSIGANTTIDRGTIEDTVIEDGVILDNLIQIGHNVRVGAHTAMAALCGIAGSTKIGERCMIAGAVVMVGHLSLCDDVMVTFHSTVTRSITMPGTYSGSLPADEASRWRRNAARFRKLDGLAVGQGNLKKRFADLMESITRKTDE